MISRVVDSGGVVTELQNNVNRWYNPELGKWLSEDPLGFNGMDANLYCYVGNAVLDYVDILGYIAKMVAFPPIPIVITSETCGNGSIVGTNRLGLLSNASQIISSPVAPGEVNGGNLPPTFLGMPNGWNHLYEPSSLKGMNQDCCLTSAPNNITTGAGTGMYKIYGLPSDGSYSGTAGANPCVALTIKCDDAIHVYHFGVGTKPPDYATLGVLPGKHCRAFVCGGGNERSSRCLKEDVIRSVYDILDGVSDRNTCGWSNVRGKEGWYIK